MGFLLLIYDFFVSLEALKCSVRSQPAQEPLWIPALGGEQGEGAGGAVSSGFDHSPHPPHCFRRASGPQHHLINLGFPSRIFSDAKRTERSSQSFRESCESPGRKPKGYVPAWPPLASPSWVAQALCAHSRARLQSGIHYGQVLELFLSTDPGMGIPNPLSIPLTPPGFVVKTGASQASASCCYRGFPPCATRQLYCCCLLARSQHLSPQQDKRSLVPCFPAWPAVHASMKCHQTPGFSQTAGQPASSLPDLSYQVPGAPPATPLNQHLAGSLPGLLPLPSALCLPEML